MELTAQEKITKVKILLQKEKPFFAYILLHMNEKENNNCKTLGVNKYGRMVFNSDYVNELESEKLKSAVCHEAMHIVLKHFWRLDKRDMQIFNIATDCAVNCILLNDNFKMAKEWILPNSNNELEIMGEVIAENVDKKSAEELYDEIYNKLKEMGMGKGEIYNKLKEMGKSMGKGESGEGDGKEGVLPIPQDEHMNDEEGKENFKDENGNVKDDKEIDKFWKDVLVEAATIAKQKGKLPNGMELFIDKLINPKVNWKHLLHKVVSNSIPFDYTWARPSKKSYSTGIYFPKVLSENVEVLISIDTSGSIQQKELTEFVSEIVGMAKSFNNIKMTILVCDAEIHEVYEIKNGNIPKILKMKIRGGGGTSHKGVIDYIIDKKLKTKLLIAFTDGYSDIEEEFPRVKCNKLIILPEISKSPEELRPYAQVIKVKYTEE